MSANDGTWIWIPLAGGSAAKVDLADWPKVKDLRWFCAVGGRGACAAVSPKPERRYVMLHRLVAGVTDARLVVRAKNGDVFDCRRSNLEVIARSVTAAESYRPRGPQHCGGLRRVVVSRRGRSWPYAVVTFRGKRHYTKTEAAASELLMGLRARCALGSAGVSSEPAESFDHEGMAQMCHAYGRKEAA